MRLFIIWLALAPRWFYTLVGFIVVIFLAKGCIA